MPKLLGPGTVHDDGCRRASRSSSWQPAPLAALRVRVSSGRLCPWLCLHLPARPASASSWWWPACAGLGTPCGTPPPGLCSPPHWICLRIEIEKESQVYYKPMYSIGTCIYGKIKFHEIVKSCIPLIELYELWMSSKLFTLDCYFPEINPPPPKKNGRGGGRGGVKGKLDFIWYYEHMHLNKATCKEYFTNAIPPKKKNKGPDLQPTDTMNAYGPLFLTSQTFCTGMTVWPRLSGIFASAPIRISDLAR